VQTQVEESDAPSAKLGRSLSLLHSCTVYKSHCIVEFVVALLSGISQKVYGRDISSLLILKI
jgi:hypothetical protein